MSQQAPRLADRVRADGPLPPDNVATLLLPVADSLTSLHAHSGRHGAVSPRAIAVDESGYATLLGSTSVAADPAFTAPEVAAGNRADHRADVWSFAGVLLHAATAQPPCSPPAGPRDGGWLRPVIELGLLPDPRERPTMEDVAAYLRARVAPEAVHHDTRHRLSGPTMALVGLAIVVLLGSAGVGLLLAGGDDRAGAPPASRPSPEQTTAEPTSRPTPRTRPARTKPTAGELERFARRYVATASARPERGYARLTRNYQQSSPRYLEVWSAIEDPEILSISADPQAMSVRYTYRYRLPGGVVRTEAVTLRVVQRADRLLIAGASARPL